MKIAVIIPARYGSTRFPGKPLAKIAGQSMLARVADIARAVQQRIDNVDIFVATEDQRIADHCVQIDIPCIMTSDDCPTGSDRVLQAVHKTGKQYDFIFGLQGDAPFTPPDALSLMIDAVCADPSIKVITPVVPLRWEELDALRQSKEHTPFTGTTAIIAKDGRALWFSKTILPGMRKEAQLREKGEWSPVYQHLGLYGYTHDTLEQFVNWPQGNYEQLEGLEQLRFLENNVAVHTVKLDVDLGMAQAGVDSPEDIERAERILSVEYSSK